MEKYFKLSAKEAEDEAKSDAIGNITRGITRRRLDLEEAESDANSALKEVKVIRSLNGFDAKEWITDMEDAAVKAASASTELKNFNTIFPTKA